MMIELGQKLYHELMSGKYKDPLVLFFNTTAFRNLWVDVYNELVRQGLVIPIEILSEEEKKQAWVEVAKEAKSYLLSKDEAINVVRCVRAFTYFHSLSKSE